MNATQIAHIFWKEYRYQRSIWLGILLIIVVVQALVWGLMPPNAQNQLTTLVSIGASLSVFYALASAGVLFAGEREERTHEWLRILPLSSGVLFTGKLLWLVASALLSLIVTSLTAYLPYWGTSWNTGKMTQGFFAFLLFGGGLALLGIFYSLNCRRIYTALALAPFTLLVVAGLNSYLPGLIYFVYGGVLVATIAQARRWATADSLLDWVGTPEKVSGFALDEAVATSVEASPAWRFFRRELWLEWNNAPWVALGSCCILIASIYFLLFSGLPKAGTINWSLMYTVLPLVYGLNTVRGEQYQNRYRFQSHAGVSPAALWVVKHLVWFSLLGLTMMVTFLSVAAPWLDESLGKGRFQLSVLLCELFEVPSDGWSVFLYNQFEQSTELLVWFSLSMACWMYAVGHVCSLLIRRSVSAALVAVAVAALVYIPVEATLLLDVPRTIGILLPAGLLLLFSLWRTNGWLTERNEKRDWFRVFGVLGLLGLVCVTSWVMWRISELTMPPVVAGFVSLIPIAGLLQYSLFGGVLLILMLLVALFRVRRKLTFQRVFLGWSAIHILSGIAFCAGFDSRLEPHIADSQNLIPPTEEAVQTGDQYRDLSLLVSGDLPWDDSDSKSRWSNYVLIGKGEVSEAQWTWLDQNQEALQKLLALTERADCAPSDLVNHWASENHNALYLDTQRVVPLLQLSALRAEAAGDLNEAWRFHRAMLRMHRQYLLYQPPVARTYNLRIVNEYYSTDLKRWINHPQQTSQLLVQATEDFCEILAETPRMKSSIELQYHGQLSALEQDRLGSWVHSEHVGAASPQFMFQALETLPWEHQRSIYMLRDVYNQQRQVAEAIETGDARVYGPELAVGAQRIRYDYPEWAIWNWYESSPTAYEDADRWQLADSTPLFRGQDIEGFGTAPAQDTLMWVREVEWVRNRRLIVLNMAFRAAGLEQSDPVHSLDQLLELKKYSSVRSILEWGEKSEAEKDWQNRTLSNDYPLEFQQHWFYVDPFRFRRFDIETIDEFRRPPAG